MWCKKKQKPIHEVELPAVLRRNIITFHALTGCDTTSSFSRVGKKTAWKTFNKYPELLNNVMPGNTDALTLDHFEEFVCRLYGCDCSHVNKARHAMFLKAKDPEGLPPTQNALRHHLRRVHHQVTVWMQAVVTTQLVPDPTESGGWRKDQDGTCLTPILMSKESVPAACLQLVTCGYKTKCSTAKCTCYIKGLVCTGACGCGADFLQKSKRKRLNLQISCSCTPSDMT